MRYGVLNDDLLLSRTDSAWIWRFVSISPRVTNRRALGRAWWRHSICFTILGGGREMRLGHGGSPERLLRLCPWRRSGERRLRRGPWPRAATASLSVAAVERVEGSCQVNKYLHRVDFPFVWLNGESAQLIKYDSRWDHVETMADRQWWPDRQRVDICLRNDFSWTIRYLFMDGQCYNIIMAR